MHISFFEVVTTYSVVLFILVSLVFVLAQLKRDNSIMDIAYGPLFLLSSLTTILLLESYSLVSSLILGGTALWALRLGNRIYRKNKGAPEDARYAAWRTAWSARGHWYFLLRSYLQINILQGIIIGLVSLPFLLSLTYGETSAVSGTLLILGSLVYLTGLTLESVADYQLDQFITRKKAGTETATLMTSGLFTYSRRPNYFGETLIWWGFAVMVLTLPFGYLGIISPLLITYIVTKVTGPMLEKIFLTRYPAEYRAYMDKTSYFFPLPPRSKAKEEPVQ